MDVEVTELFLRNYRRTNNRSQIRNTLLALRQRMDSSPNWLHSYEHITNCALKTTFRAKLSHMRLHQSAHRTHSFPASVSVLVQERLCKEVVLASVA